MKSSLKFYLVCGLVSLVVSGCSYPSSKRPDYERNKFGGAGDVQLEKTRAVERMRDAAQVYGRIITAPDGNIPEKLMKKAECVAVLPNVLKAAFIAGGRFGKGVLSCRDVHGKWSAPSFIRLSGGSVGWQIGAESADMVLFFVGKEAKDAVIGERLTLGGDISIAAGPVGRGAQGSTDFNHTGIYSYAATQGIFAGISLNGAALTQDMRATTAFYEKPFTTSELVSGKDKIVPDVLPTEAQQFLAILP